MFDIRPDTFGNAPKDPHERAKIFLNQADKLKYTLIAFHFWTFSPPVIKQHATGMCKHKIRLLESWVHEIPDGLRAVLAIDP